MRVETLAHGVARAEVDGRETAALHRTVAPLVDRLDSISEIEALDYVQAAAERVKNEIPDVVRLLANIASHRGPKVAVVALPELGLEAIGPTPVDYLGPGQRNLFQPDLYRALLLAIAGWYAYGYTTQQDGVVHNNVVAVERLADVPGTSASTRHTLDLHTEDASFNYAPGHDLSPDFVTLHFFRNPAGVPTTVSFPDWAKLSAATRSRLWRPWFTNRTNPGQGGAANDPSRPVAIVYGPHDEPWFRINTARLEADRYDGPEREALLEFAAHLESRQMGFALGAGELLIVDNRRAAHGRPAYAEARFNGAERWQRRVVVSSDPARIQAFEASTRVADAARFVEAIGSTRPPSVVGQGRPVA